jgi:hypothetical protein
MVRRLLHSAVTRMAIEIGRGIAGIGGVHLRRLTLQLFGERQTYRVQRGLRTVVGQRITHARCALPTCAQSNQAFATWAFATPARPVRPKEVQAVASRVPKQAKS